MILTGGQWPGIMYVCMQDFTVELSDGCQNAK